MEARGTPGPGATPPAGGGIYNDGGNVTLSAIPVTGNQPNNCEPATPAVEAATRLWRRVR